MVLTNVCFVIFFFSFVLHLWFPIFNNIKMSLHINGLSYAYSQSIQHSMKHIGGIQIYFLLLDIVIAFCFLWFLWVWNSPDLWKTRDKPIPMDLKYCYLISQFSFRVP